MDLLKMALLVPRTGIRVLRDPRPQMIWWLWFK
jgi:hypothetical protein